MFSETLKVHHPMCRLLNRLEKMRKASIYMSKAHCFVRLHHRYNIAHTRLAGFVNTGFMQHLIVPSQILEITNSCTAYAVKDLSSEYADEECKGSKRGHSNEFRSWYLLGFSLLGFGSKNDEKVEEDALTWELKKAKYSEKIKEYKAAEEQYHNALSILRDRKESGAMKPDEVLRTQVLIFGDLANLCFTVGNLEKAEALYNEMLKGFTQMGNLKESPATVEITLKLSMIYSMQERLEEADTGYNSCIEIMENMMNRVLEEQKRREKGAMEQEEMSTKELEADLKNSMELLVISYKSYSRFLYDSKKYQEAEKIATKALKLGEQNLGPKHSQMVALYNELAGIMVAQERLDEALTYVDKGIDLARHHKHENLPQMMYNVGKLHIMRKDYILGHQYCRNAMDMAKLTQDKRLHKAAESCMSQAEKLESSNK